MKHKLEMNLILTSKISWILNGLKNRRKKKLKLQNLEIRMETKNLCTSQLSKVLYSATKIILKVLLRDNLVRGQSKFQLPLEKIKIQVLSLNFHQLNSNNNHNNSRKSNSSNLNQKQREFNQKKRVRAELSQSEAR